MQPNKVGIILLGASGFGAGELLRLLTNHTECEVAGVVSNSQPGAKLSDLHPQLAGFYDTPSAAQVDFELLEQYQRRCLISTLPNGVSSNYLAPLLAECERREIRIIDLSGDFRLKDLKLHGSFYPQAQQSPLLRDNWQYGLPELFAEEIASAQRIANPGCLATAAILALAPLSSASIEWAALSAATGSSGAGRELKATTQHALRHGNFCAYKVLRHQHEPEILQTLAALRPGFEINLSFVPHSLPLVRGIYLTAQIRLSQALSCDQARTLYRKFYAHAPFMRVVGNEAAELGSVLGSNYCEIACQTRGHLLVVTAALDNLVKGMAGQALQNLNLMFGLPQEQGLCLPGLRLV